VGVRELKARLSEYLRRAPRREINRVTDRGRAKAALAPLPDDSGKPSLAVFGRSVLVAFALALPGCDSTEPNPFPDIVGTYTFDALFRDALATDLRARGTLTFTHVDRETGRLIGEADVQLLLSGQPPIPFTAFELASVTREGEITFRLHLPDLIGTWTFTGTVSPSLETMGGSHELETVEADYLGTWTAARM
jgi:antitoxin (DNA-binding transcriptional repressor) of toxin-antitoxin stability system